MALLLSLLTDPGLLFTLLAEPSVLLRLVRQLVSAESISAARRFSALPPVAPPPVDRGASTSG